MKIVVTGSAGYVGSTLCGELLARGHDVVGVDSLMHGGEAMLGFIANPKFTFVRGDLREESTISRAVEGADAVVHLAAIVGDPACKRDPDLARGVNYQASMSLINAAEKAGASRFVFASTCSNYGKMGEGEESVDESSPLTPLSVYAETKVSVEKHLLDNDWRKSFSPTVLRLSTVYGLSARPRFDLTVNEFAAELLLKGELTVFGEQFWRPYIHVRDVARGVIAVLEAPAEKVRGEVFNLGRNDQNYQKQTLVEIIQQRLPDVKITYVKQVSDPRDYRVRFEKIRSVLGFELEHTVESGIDEILAALRAGVIADTKNPHYSN
ncbi:MAG: NAD(P)-dependent oxidoreductase [Phycisphaerae bacterium]|nr:NAD(P)-dependent oxidoreductase [Gemmatimonadaceae bacterium]